MPLTLPVLPRPPLPRFTRITIPPGGIRGVQQQLLPRDHRPEPERHHLPRSPVVQRQQPPVAVQYRQEQDRGDQRGRLPEPGPEQERRHQALHQHHQGVRPDPAEELPADRSAGPEQQLPGPA